MTRVMLIAAALIAVTPQASAPDAFVTVRARIQGLDCVIVTRADRDGIGVACDWPAEKPQTAPRPGLAHRVGMTRTMRGRACARLRGPI